METAKQTGLKIVEAAQAQAWQQRGEKIRDTRTDRYRKLAEAVAQGHDGTGEEKADMYSGER